MEIYSLRVFTRNLDICNSSSSRPNGDSGPLLFLFLHHFTVSGPRGELKRQIDSGAISNLKPPQWLSQVSWGTQHPGHVFLDFLQMLHTKIVPLSLLPKKLPQSAEKALHLTTEVQRKEQSHPPIEWEKALVSDLPHTKLLIVVLGTVVANWWLSFHLGDKNKLSHSSWKRPALLMICN